MKTGRCYTTGPSQSTAMQPPSPQPSALPTCSVLLLAGGRGQRMGGQDKGLLDWHGQPLIAHLHALTRPLSDDLIISCNRNAERYRAYADRVVHDHEGDFPGPLAGIRAGLAVARHPQVLILPCDAPCLDSALLHSLLSAAGETPVMLRQGEHWQPLFCLLPRHLRIVRTRQHRRDIQGPSLLRARLVFASEQLKLQCAPLVQILCRRWHFCSHL